MIMNWLIFYIHTSIGFFIYHVSAIGTTNPYRLRPFIGAKVPLNGSYATLIHIYNPHTSTLQLTEMYTTGGGLHLELPNGDNEANAELWQVAPFETKTVMRAIFLARSEKNHTAYVRIKTNSSDNDSMIFPVEVEFSSKPGIYSPVDMIDFGMMRSNDPPKTLPLLIIRAGRKSISIHEVVTTPYDPSITIDFTSPVLVTPDIFHPTEVARITLNPSLARNCQLMCGGHILVKSKNDQYKLMIPYQVFHLKGALTWNAETTQFYFAVGSQETEKRWLTLKNEFKFPLLIYSVSVAPEAMKHFKVRSKYTAPDTFLVLQPNQSDSVIKIAFTPSEELTNLRTCIRIHTNISHFDIPLHAYSGKLQLFIPRSINQSVLHFGAIGLKKMKSMVFAVINNNPVDIYLRNWGSNMTRTRVEYLGVEEGDPASLLQGDDFAKETTFGNFVRTLKPGNYALFKLHLLGFDNEGVNYGNVFVETEYEELNIPFFVRSVDGSFTVNKISINDAFPGKVSKQDVKITSLFAHELSLKSWKFLPQKDERFSFETFGAEVHPGENVIGEVSFDPSKNCEKQCYTGLDTSKEVGHLWLLGLALHQDTGYIDKELHKLLYSRWSNLSRSERSNNATLQLEIDGVAKLDLSITTNLKWPRFFSKNHLKFSITRIGNLTAKEVAIENPSSQTVLVQVSLLSNYPNPDSALQLIRSGFHASWSDTEFSTLETKPKSFRLLNVTSPDVIASHKKIKEALGVTPDTNSVTLLMPPGYKTKLHIGFQPKDDFSLAGSLLLVRNNLTILDALYISGQGGNGLLKIGNQFPGPNSILSFELLEKHLKSCTKNNNNGNSYVIEPTFSVHRSFTAVNVGRLTMRITGFHIGSNSPGVSSQPCEGFGFKILNCNGFDLRPNENRKIHIAFTPDFTQSKAVQTLSILTDTPSETLTYSLIATLPKHLLPLCNEVLPRPSWEVILNYCVIVLMIFIVFTAVCLAFFDAGRILNYSFYPMLATYTVVQNAEKQRQALQAIEAVQRELHEKKSNEEQQKKKNELRQRKNRGSGVASASKVANGGPKESFQPSYYQKQTWASFLKSKFTRRDSTESDKSNTSSKSGEEIIEGQESKAKTNGRQRENASHSKKIDLEKNPSSKRNKRDDPKRVALREKNQEQRRQYELTKPLEPLTNVVCGPPPPLPSFPSAFDDDDEFIRMKKGKLASKPSDGLDLPYKIPKASVNKDSSQGNKEGRDTQSAKENKEKKGRNKGGKANLIGDGNDSVCSSNESSIIWDSPITTFDTDAAMDDLYNRTKKFFNEDNVKVGPKGLPPRAATIDADSGSVWPVTSKAALEQNTFGNAFSGGWNGNRTITPPARSNTLAEMPLERSTPPALLAQTIPPAIRAAPKSAGWFSGTENQLDKELNLLRETSSPWNVSSGGPPKPVHANDWGIFNSFTSKSSSWFGRSDTANGSAPIKPASNGFASSNGNVWGDSSTSTVVPPPNVWDRAVDEKTWGQPKVPISPPPGMERVSPTQANFASLSPSPSAAPAPIPASDSFSLFGSSPWSPFGTSSTTSVGTKPTGSISCDDSASTQQQEENPLSASSWTSFASFPLFGSLGGQKGSQTSSSSVFDNKSPINGSAGSYFDSNTGLNQDTGNNFDPPNRSQFN